MSVDIRARLDAERITISSAAEGDEDAVLYAAHTLAPALLAFARDVLDLHTPVTHGRATGWLGGPFTECCECQRPWPCPTVAAAEHLGGEA